MSTTMVYRSGYSITCGPFSLDYKIVDDEDVKAALADGWYATPEEADEAGKAEENARKEAALNAEIEANKKALEAANQAGNGVNKKPRQPKRTPNDAPGDLGADVTNADGTNPDNPDNTGEED